MPWHAASAATAGRPQRPPTPTARARATNRTERVSLTPILPHTPTTRTWPLATLVTVVCAEEAPAQTRVTVRFAADGAVTAEELATFVSERAGMTKRSTGSFDALEGLLMTRA